MISISCTAGYTVTGLCACCDVVEWNHTNHFIVANICHCYILTHDVSTLPALFKPYLTWKSVVTEKFTLCDMHRIMTWENARTYLFCTPGEQLACTRRKKVSLFIYMIFRSLASTTKDERKSKLWNWVSSLGIYVAFVNGLYRVNVEFYTKNF